MSLHSTRLNKQDRNRTVPWPEGSLSGQLQTHQPRYSRHGYGQGQVLPRAVDILGSPVFRELPCPLPALFPGMLLSLYREF